MENNNQIKNNKYTTTYTDDFESLNSEPETIHEVQKYFDQPLRSDSCCGNQSHLFMLEKLSWKN